MGEARAAKDQTAPEAAYVVQAAPEEVVPMAEAVPDLMLEWRAAQEVAVQSGTEELAQAVVEEARAIRILGAMEDFLAVAEERARMEEG